MSAYLTDKSKTPEYNKESRNGQIVVLEGCRADSYIRCKDNRRNSCSDYERS